MNQYTIVHSVLDGGGVPLITPMKLKNMPDNFDPALFTEGIIAEPKLNGHRQLIQVIQGQGIVKAWSRNGKNTLWKLNYEIQNQITEWDTGVYDGELHLGFGSTFEDVLMKDNRPYFGYTAFDYIIDSNWNDITSLTYAKRRTLLHKAITSQSRATIIPIQIIKSRNELRYCLKRILVRRGEGLVLKLLNRSYSIGERTDAFMKLKKWPSDKFDLNLSF